MTFRAPSFLLASLALVGLLLAVYWPRTPDEYALSQQLAGAHCRFAYENDVCRQRGLEPMRRLFTEDHDCDTWAVKCLSDLRSSAAVDAMITVLSTKTDVQTCDGVRPIRSEAVRYLAKAKDKRALPALRKLAASAPKQTLSGGASGCEPAYENVANIQQAIKSIEMAAE